MKSPRRPRSSRQTVPTHAPVHAHAPVVLDVPGLSLDESDRRRLLHPLTGGVILFARNWHNRAQLTSLCAEIKSVRDDLLICVDHEGGRVQRFKTDGFTHVPAMRRLGEMWTDDRASFVDVTIGLCRLHEALHRISEQSDAQDKPEAVEAPSILIAVAPGEQHVFGVLMAGELFRKQGWSVTTETSGDAATITALMASRRFDMAGLSISHDGATDGVTRLIKAMRKEHTPFLYLPDQDFGPRDAIFVKFFATDAATITGKDGVLRTEKDGFVVLDRNALDEASAS